LGLTRSRKMRWAYRVLAGKSARKRPLGRSRLRLRDNITTNLK
jgi:hypothetical protein